MTRPEDTASDEGASADAGAVDAALAVAARHALHDEELVAALATGSLDDAADVMRAQGVVDRCAACRELHGDIAVIGNALRTDAKGTVAAPRDFRLSVEDAQRLGGTVLARGYIASLRRSMASLAPSLGASMAALGVVGILVGSLALGGGKAGAPVAAGTGSGDASSGPAEIQTGSHQSSEPKSSERTGAFGPKPSAAPVDGGSDGGDPMATDSSAAQANPAAWLLAGSVGLLVAGIALLVIALRRGRGSGARDPHS